MARCSRCGEDNPARARFCLACGAPLAPAGEPREVRKTVTVVFSDLVGSTPLGERLDPEALREVVTRYYDRTAEVLTRHGGTVAKFIGDAVMAVYGIPRLHEDDALRAVRAAGELGRALEELNGELEAALGVRLALRTGVNTGEVVVGDAVGGQDVVVGDAVNVAARLEQAADPGEVLIGVRPDAAGHARHLDAPMVSRDRELGLLAGGLERAVGERRGLLTVVLGPAGVGKSRLVQEFVATVRGRATVLRGRCLEYEEGLTYWPVAEVVRDAVATGGPEAPGGAPAGLRRLLEGTEHAAYVAEALAGIEGAAGRTASGEDVPWAVARLFEALARRRPLVVVLDDLHWAEPTLLDLVEQAVDAVRGAPLLLVGTARPELLDDRPWWGAAAPDVLPVVLEPLGVEACGRLVANLLGGAALPGEVARAIAEAAGGNPLFVEELVAELLDRGVLTRTGGRWTATADLAHVPVPATIWALLAARLERLEAEERAVLERASVVGQVFDRRAVEALSPEPARAAVGRHLAALARRELVHPDGPAGSFRFRHVLVRDVAYEALPKRRRAELHERLAGWLDGGPGDAPAPDEIVGYHFEQAYRNRAELGRAGLRESELARQGAARLAAGGRRALGRDDASAAVNLLGRAVSLLPAGDPGRLDPLLDLGDALTEAGDWSRARQVIGEAVDRARAAGDRRQAARGSVAELYLRETTSPRGWTDDARREAMAAITLFERTGDRAGLANGWRLIAHASNRRLRLAELERVGWRIVDDARRAGDRRTETRILGGISASLSLGPTPAAEAAERCQRILAELGGAPRPTMMALDSLALCSAMLGRLDEAERLLRRADAIREGLAGKLWKVGRVDFGAWTYLLAGRPAEAERVLRPAYGSLRRIGERGGALSIHAAMLAQAIFAAGGRDEEAERLSELAEAAAADSDDVAAQGEWRMARATALARRGSAAEAERLATEAVEVAAATDCPLVQTWTLLTLARVLRLAGRPAEARRAARDALAVAEGKGDLASSSAAQALLDELGSAQPAR